MEEMDAGNIVPGVIKVGTDREGKTGQEGRQGCLF